MTVEVDARGFGCPQPILKTKEALEKAGDEDIKVLVDNSTARNNVKRFAESQGCQVSVEEVGEEFHIMIKK